MKCAVIAGTLCSVLSACGAMAQNSLSGTSTETHSNMEMSSVGGMMAAMRAPVTGASYVAEKVTRSVWTLGDGTKITHGSSSKMARDAEGRVREGIEHRDAGSIGGQQINKTLESITIGDPVERTMTIWTVGPGKIAIRMHLPNVGSAGARAGGELSLSVEGPPPVRVTPPPAPQGGGVVGPGMMMGRFGAERDEVQTEELGSDAIGGVRVEGRRTITTIATGKIGNDRPIVITHEEWYSPDLKLVVKSVDEDPRTGERTMELEGLTIGEPDSGLFKVPEGYQVRDMPDMLKTLDRPAKPVGQ